MPVAGEPGMQAKRASGRRVWERGAPWDESRSGRGETLQEATPAVREVTSRAEPHIVEVKSAERGLQTAGKTNRLGGGGIASFGRAGKSWPGTSTGGHEALRVLPGAATPQSAPPSPVSLPAAPPTCGRFVGNARNKRFLSFELNGTLSGVGTSRAAPRSAAWVLSRPRCPHLQSPPAR